MALYYGIFFIIALASFMEMYGLTRRDSIKLYCILCLSLFVMSFIRWETGTDWQPYFQYFKGVSAELFPESNFEIGYTFLNGLTKILTDQYTVLLLFCAIILFSFQSSAIYKLSPYPIFSLVFWWGINYAGVFFVRQTIAMAILLFAVQYIRDRRFWMFLLCIGLATLFHRTSLFFILAYWIYKLRMNWIVMIIGVFTAIGFAGIADAIMQSLGQFVGGVIQAKIDAYTGDVRGDLMGLSQSLPVIIAKAFFSKLLLIIAALLMLKRIDLKYPEFRGYLNLYWFGAIIFLMTITISPGLARLGNSFDIMQIILLPYIIQSFDNKNNKLIVIILSFAYIALRLYTVTTGGYYDEYVPYKTFFEQ